MNLEFVKNGDSWVAEFKVTDQFNLHLEMAERGNVLIMQKTPANGKYAVVEDAGKFNFAKVMDFDSGSFLGEKYVKVVSEVAPLYAFLTTSGEVTEIKSQSKEVEITGNGTTEVTPDAGFAYMDRVSVKVNVPNEGGASAMEYYEISGLSGQLSMIVMFSSVAKYLLDGQPATGPSYYTDSIKSANNFGGYLAVGFDMSMRLTQGDQMMSLKDLLAQYNLVGMGAKEITEDEFYNFDE